MVAVCYNYAMGAVDYLNREAFTTYRGKIRTRKVWKHFFHVLLHLAVYLAFCLYQFAYYTCRKNNGKPWYESLGVSPNKTFRLRLADELCKEQREHYHSLRRFRRSVTPVAKCAAGVEEILLHTAQKIQIIPKFKGKRAECAWCRLTHRQTRGSQKSKSKAKVKKHCTRSAFGCAQCGKGLCLGRCFIKWHEHIFLQGETGPECVPESFDDLSFDFD